MHSRTALIYSITNVLSGDRASSIRRWWRSCCIRGKEQFYALIIVSRIDIVCYMIRHFSGTPALDKWCRTSGPPPDVCRILVAVANGLDDRSLKLAGLALGGRQPLASDLRWPIRLRAKRALKELSSKRRAPMGRAGTWFSVHYLMCSCLFNGQVHLLSR